LGVIASQMIRIEIKYLEMKEKRYMWRWDVMFFLIMSIAIIVFLLSYFIYNGMCKKTNVVEEAEHEEITFIIR
jgi:hypothetical protein